MILMHLKLIHITGISLISFFQCRNYFLTNLYLFLHIINFAKSLHHIKTVYFGFIFKSTAHSHCWIKFNWLLLALYTLSFDLFPWCFKEAEWVRLVTWPRFVLKLNPSWFPINRINMGLGFTLPWIVYFNMGWIYTCKIIDSLLCHPVFLRDLLPDWVLIHIHIEGLR